MELLELITAFTNLGKGEEEKRRRTSDYSRGYEEGYDDCCADLDGGYDDYDEHDEHDD